MKLEERIQKLEEKFNELDKKQLKDRMELSALIKDAVSEAIKPIIIKQEEQANKLKDLASAEAYQALESKKEVWKTVKTITITFIITLLLNNCVDIFMNNVKTSNESEIMINEKDNSNN